MSIAAYIKVIGRQTPISINREQATDLLGQVLDGTPSDFEIGAFCMAMRIKSETAEELAGFIDATHTRLNKLSITTPNTPVVVLPSYNGARKLPVLTPLLSALLAREGVAVVLHGTPTENGRVTALDVMSELGLSALTQPRAISAGEQVFVPTEVLCPGLKKLLDVRRFMGLRNAAHSLVKMINPVQANALVVGSYTHPYYIENMMQAWQLTHINGMLLRGTEGEVVADARRRPQMQAIIGGTQHMLMEGQTGSLTKLPELPQTIDAATTAAYITSVLEGQSPIPEPIADQVKAIMKALSL